MDSAVAESDELLLTELTAIFRLLSDRTRLNILLMLANGERNVGSLCDQLKLPQPTVSHHLGLLRVHDVIANRRAGKQVFYGLKGKVESGSAAVAIQLQTYDLRISKRTSDLSEQQPSALRASDL